MSSQNYFEWFSLAPDFAIDLQDLRHRYLELQKQLHPDRSAGESTQNQSEAVIRNAKLNDAYDKLKNPVKRAVYLLELAGQHYDADRQTQDDVAYLMQQLEIREELAEVNIDTAEADEKLQQFRSLAMDHLEQYSQDFQLAYKDNNWTKAGIAIGRMMFADKLMRDVNDREEELLDL